MPVSEVSDAVRLYPANPDDRDYDLRQDGSRQSAPCSQLVFAWRREVEEPLKTLSNGKNTRRVHLPVPAGGGRA